ncbi:hypothetical protein SAMN05216276_1006189 [Streptosporangium subroseum]|uniref:HTH-type transcriptional repressor Sco4008 C-terminal domain-containing protein n=1 Tax=Streptosporangium subroseum TaxID=106412 RepID=A0A239D177_9ACTN|nr:hypothetical protein [Streptosporangium subroseum]SNS25778.1 hypothetical protein SAMN05216276_1006189 [Streptosporangium subroseum]
MDHDGLGLGVGVQNLDAVLTDQVEGILDAAPLTAEDLPGYAVRLYDAYLVHPQLVRLANWARLERTPGAAPR